MKPLQIVRFDSSDGDTHYVFIKSTPFEKNIYSQDYDENIVKKASKKEASKPLNLKRSE